MSTNAVDVSFSFLVSGPTFRVLLPDEFEPLPELNSPLYNGVGGRDFTFFPGSRGEAAGDVELLRTLTDRDGRDVELYERIDTPPLWWLRWHLRAGMLYTHLREEDGESMADVTVKSLSIVESDTGLPVLLAYPPMAVDMVAIRDFEEEAIYFSKDRSTDRSITLRRPSYMEKAEVETPPLQNTRGRAITVAGVGAGTEVMVIAGDDTSESREIAQVVVDSFSEA